MVCPNCESETNGLKLNNRLYCTECGFLLSPPKEENEETENTKPVAQKVSEPQIPLPEAEEPKAKIISDENKEFSLAPLEAEEEVLDLVIDEAKELEGEKKEEPKDNGSLEVTLKTKLPKSTHKIEKHNRPRTDLKKEGDYVLLPGEPDPIAEPEIGEGEEALEIAEVQPPVPAPAPASTQSTKMEDIRKPKVENEEVSEPAKSPISRPGEEKLKGKNPNSELLLNYFRQANKAEPAKSITKKKKKKFKWGLFWTVFISSVIVIALIALVSYVTLIAPNPNFALTQAENSTNFQHLKIGYLPAGYSLSSSTKGNSSSITYAYAYLPDKAKTLTVKAEKTTLVPDDVRPKVIDPTGKSFVNVSSGGRSLWLVGDDTLFFISDNILYTIASNSDLSQAELVKVADGLH